MARSVAIRSDTRGACINVYCDAIRPTSAQSGKKHLDTVCRTPSPQVIVNSGVCDGGLGGGQPPSYSENFQRTFASSSSSSSEQEKKRPKAHLKSGPKMFCSRRALQQWCFALFLLCSPVPHYGRPIDALSGRMKRSVTHAQLMHDKGRTLQDFKRRMWLQELLHEVHTAAIRELPVRPPLSSSSSGGGGVGGAVGGAVGGGGVSVVLPGLATTINLSTTGSTLHSKPPGGTKNLPLSFRLEEEEGGGGTNLPQETHKSQAYKDRTSGKKKKKGRSGKRREGEKRKRRARSLRWLAQDEAGSGYHLGWRPLWGLQRAQH
ncbi:Parathyroid hormone-related protein [Merluccius polli]|uniref:Parathyroid hormone-related protein n=1 Tax=Merluccius polli TaxID=89951 RepID=A0AA47MDZ2_MERPO|nr:Parathyroid hormone-related protein [Merluccius polli]